MFLKPIRLVTFDVTHTLLRFRLSPGQQYGEVAESLGAKINAEDIARNFKKNYKQLSVEYPNFGKSNNFQWEDWWRMVVRKTFENDIRDKTLLEVVATNLIESYKSKKSWQLNDGCTEILEYLKTFNVKIGVVSNFDPRLREILKNSGLHKYLDFILPSYEVGAMKPDEEIFKKALISSSLSNIIPSEALHVGDNAILDYKGARNAGWQAALITNQEQSVVRPIDIPNQHIFCSLVDFKDFLSKNETLLCRNIT